MQLIGKNMFCCHTLKSHKNRRINMISLFECENEKDCHFLQQLNHNNTPSEEYTNNEKIDIISRGQMKFFFVLQTSQTINLQK